MGDMADWFIDDHAYLFGFPSYERDRDLRWCRYCGTGQLHWRETDTGWRLHDKHGDIHNCQQDDVELEFESLD